MVQAGALALVETRNSSLLVWSGMCDLGSEMVVGSDGALDRCRGGDVSTYPVETESRCLAVFIFKGVAASGAAFSSSTETGMEPVVSSAVAAASWVLRLAGGEGIEVLMPPLLRLLGLVARVATALAFWEASSSSIETGRASSVVAAARESSSPARARAWSILRACLHVLRWEGPPTSKRGGGTPDRITGVASARRRCG
ncbi:Os08g0234900 [Oryza sativa Japonica Group]|uniref:Os08g0234900 protein n=1 Tax=Oryza sativa subsp. japonica TaxID=39947 RepID=A0A0P0XDG7_ORYSJ|nr:Os08g0234900 [Oryza sativa Japonica Group]